MANAKHFIYSHWLKWYYKAAKQKLGRFPANPRAGDGVVKAEIKYMSGLPKLQPKH